MLDGAIFGFADNAILLAGAYWGASVETMLGGKTARGAILGAAFGNTVSDGIGAAIDPALQPMVAGIVLGTLIPIAFIPAIEWMRARRAH